MYNNITYTNIENTKLLHYLYRKHFDTSRVEMHLGVSMFYIGLREKDPWHVSIENLGGCYLIFHLGTRQNYSGVPRWEN